MCVHPLSAASVANAPTPTDIEAARRAWLATAGATGGHLDVHAACPKREGCEAYAALDDDDERAWADYEATKGGSNGYR